MIDSSIASESTSDTMASEAEFPVAVDTLAIGGTSPEVGDTVDVKVRGPVTRVVNGVAFIRPETVNDQPMPTPPIKPDPNVADWERLNTLSKQVDSERGATY